MRACFHKRRYCLYDDRMLWVSLVLMTAAVARVTRLITKDAITLSFRRWVVNRWGDGSGIAYLVHCSWCTSIWIALPAAVGWTFTMLPMRLWWLALPVALAMSYATGLLSQIEEQ